MDRRSFLRFGATFAAGMPIAVAQAAATENDPRKVELAAGRYACMGFGEHYLDEAVHLARQEKALLLHTGDMIDFVSNANLRYAGLTYGSDDWFVSAGNHEFSRYVDFDGIVRKELAELASGIPFDVFRIDDAPMAGAAVAAARLASGVRPAGGCPRGGGR